MKMSLILRQTHLVGLLFLGLALYSCSDSTSVSEKEIDGLYIAPSEAVQKSIKQEALFTIVPEPKLTEDQEQHLSVIRNRPTTSEVHIARIASAPEIMLQKGNSVVLNISPGEQFIAIGEKETRRGPIDISWAGPLKDERGWAQLVLTDKGITGTLRKDSRLFKFEPIGRGIQVLTYIDSSIKFSDQPTGYPPSGALIDTAGSRNDSGHLNI